MLMMLLFYTSATGQIQLEPIDSNHVKLSLDELRYVTAKFVEVNYLRAAGKEQQKEIGILKNIITDKDGIISVQEDQIDLYKQQIEDQRPAWWNKFSWGCIASLVVALFGFVIIK